MSQLFTVAPFTTNVTQMGWQEVNYLSRPDSSPSSPAFFFFFLNISFTYFHKNKTDRMLACPHCVSLSFQSKRKFERECREAEKSQLTYDRLDNDINATKSEVEKVRSSVELCDELDKPSSA